jgi:GAF domain-containing protein
MAVREIVHAFLTATRPEEVFQLALERVGPLVGAAFASVYLVEGTSETMRHAASFNWPERYRPFLGEMRVRIGHGPSGEAVSKRRVIEVPDVFADATLSDWRDVASELGFRAIVALPLQTSDRVLGAVAFYFAGAGGFSAIAAFLVLVLNDGPPEQVRWLAFTMLVVGQAVRAYANRSLSRPVVSLRPNGFLAAAAIVVIVIQAAIPLVPPLADAFRAVPLGAADWLLIAVVAFAPAALAELIRWRTGREWVA